jgi:hypothetical protein
VSIALVGGRIHSPDAPSGFASAIAISGDRVTALGTDDEVRDLVGAERAGWQYSIGTLLANGARVAFGSDWPVSGPDPLQELHVAVNRTLSERLGRPGTDECDKPFRMSEAITVGAAVDAFTRGVAYVNHEEGRFGSLVVGSSADLAVLDQDIFEIDRRSIGETSVALTIAAGRVVHGDE